MTDRPSCELAADVGSARWRMRKGRRAGGLAAVDSHRSRGRSGRGREGGSANRACGGSRGSKTGWQDLGTGSEWQDWWGRDGLGSDSAGLRCSWGRGAKGLRRFAVAASREV